MRFSATSFARSSARGLALSAEGRGRIDACPEVVALEACLMLAATAVSEADFLPTLPTLPESPTD